MTCGKKDPVKEEKAKSVEKLTDERLDKVSGGKNIGCAPTHTPCHPKKHHIGCPPTATPCEPKRKVGCGPTT